MKNIIRIFSILAVTLLAFGATGSALAVEPERGGSGNGVSRGTQGGLGTGTGVPVEQNIALEGILEDLIHENLAAALGISPTELAARLDAGETIIEIGLSLDFDLETLSNILTQARSDAVDQAVAAGLITQEQADWLASHGSQNPAASYGEAVCENSEDCLMDGTPQNTMSSNRYGGGHRNK